MVKISAVYLYRNGNVVVLCRRGQQVPELQGTLEDCREKVIEAADEQTEWWLGEWKRSRMSITRQQFALAQVADGNVQID